MSKTPLKQFRRCHLCGTTNHLDPDRENSVHACDGCGKHLAPFYFFEESEQSGISDNGLHLSLRAEAIGYQPLWGFSVLWELTEDEASREISPEISAEGRLRGTRKRRHGSRIERHSKGPRKD